jgi:hypothetical protein
MISGRRARAHVPETQDVCTAGRGVALKLDCARMRGLHEVVPETLLQPLDPGGISSRPTNSTLTAGIRHTASCVNSDAKRSWSRIIPASVNSPRSASISTRSAMV